MVRVAGLKRRIAAGIAVQAASGLTPRELMKRVHDRTRTLMTQHAQAFRDLMPDACTTQASRSSAGATSTSTSRRP